MPCPQGRMRKRFNDNQRETQVSDSENDNQGRLVSLTQKMIQKIALQALQKKTGLNQHLAHGSSTNTVTFHLFSLSYFDF